MGDKEKQLGMARAEDGGSASRRARHSRALGCMLVRERWQLAVAVFVFAGLLDWIYVSFLTKFSYMGFTFDPDNRWYMGLAPMLTFGCSLVLPVTIRRVADWVMWLLFWLLFSPIVILVPLQRIPEAAKWPFLACLLGSFALTVWCSRFRWRLPVLAGLPPLVRQSVFWAFYGSLFAYLLSVFGGHLRFVGFEDVYKLRSDNSELTQSGLIGYAMANLAWAVNPFLLAVGLVKRSWITFVAGFAGQVVLYSTLGHKGVLLSTVVVVGAYWVLLRSTEISSVSMAWLMVAVCALPMIPYVVGLAEDDTPIGSAVMQLVALVYMRTLGMGAAVTGAYINFFQSHPLTLYSNINIVSHFIHYPYDASLGEVIGYDLVGDDLDANASFYATDGYAALGPLGVIFIGPIFGLVLSVANAVSRSKLKLACAAVVPFVMIVANTSLFTSMLTGGGILLFLLLYLHGGRWPVRPVLCFREAS